MSMIEAGGTKSKNHYDSVLLALRLSGKDYGTGLLSLLSSERFLIKNYTRLAEFKKKTFSGESL